MLKYYNIQVDQETIAKEVYIPKLKGALITDLENYAKKLGLRTEIFKGDDQTLKDYLQKGIPVIILVDFGVLFTSMPHYLVVVGFDDRGFYAHTGYEPEKFFSYKELDRLWRRMGRVGLVVYP